MTPRPESTSTAVRSTETNLVQFLIDQFRRSRLELAIVCLGTLIVLAAVLFLNVVDDAPVEHLVRDPAALTGAPFHQGFLSNAGILLWAAAAAVSLFTAIVLARESRDQLQVRFILATSLLSIVAALDDTFLLHEQALPHVHIPEELTLAAYVAAGAAYVFSFWRLLLRTKVTLPVLAVLLIAASTALDLQYPMSTGRQIFFEEALKFGGIVSWLAFVWTASTIAITSRTVALPSSPD